jgi:predicted 3-demethylubiquinone-9 3-methyltransferase (glyoxalase superfamily)
MHAISPFLWFHTEAEDAARLYVSVFPRSRIVNVQHMGGNGDVGPVMSVTFELDGLTVQALNGAPGDIGFTEAMSFFVSCETQDEIDELWERLTADGGEAGRCGWLKDRFGMSWQIIPDILGELLGDPDPEKSARSMQAMLTMHKLDIAALQRAHDGS